MVDINLIPREYREKRDKFASIFSKTVIGFFALVVLSLLIYGGLLFYENMLKKDIEEIKLAIKNLDTKRDVEAEGIMVTLDEKLKVLKEMFESHLYWSKLVKKIEELVIPEAYFFDVQFDFLGDSLGFSFSGNALSYTDLARQIVSFQEDEFIKSVVVSNMTLSPEGGINFSLGAVFSKDILLGLEQEND